MEKLVVDAVQKGSGDEGSANLIAKVVSSASAEVTNKMISEVSNNSSGANSDLSAKVLKAIVETVPDKIATIDNNLKEKVIEQAVVSAATSKDKNNDFGNVISDVIVKSDAATAAKVMEKVTNSNDSSSLALKVMASVSEKDSKKLELISKNDSTIFNKLIEKSLKDIKGSESEVKLIAMVISKSTDQKLTEKILVETARKNTTNKTLMANVATAMIKENSNFAQSLAVTISTNQIIMENLASNPEVINVENIKSIFVQNVSPN